MAENNKFRIQLKDLNGALMFPKTTTEQVLGLGTMINERIDAAIADSLKTTSVMSFQSTVDSSNPLPVIAYRGFTYMVAEAGTYADQECEVGDLIICKGNDATDGNAPTKAYWTVIQTNLVGAVTTTGFTPGKLVAATGEHTLKTATETIGSKYAGVYLAEGELRGTTQTYAAFQVNVEDDSTLSISVFDYDPEQGFKPVDVDKKVTGTVTSPDKSVLVNWKEVDGVKDIHTVEIKIGTVVTDRIAKNEEDIVKLGSDVVRLGTTIEALDSRVGEVETKIDTKIAAAAQGGSAYGSIDGLIAGNSSDTISIVTGTGIELSTSMVLATGTRLNDQNEEEEYEYQTNQKITIGLKLSTGLELDASGALTISSSISGLQEIVDSIAESLIPTDEEGTANGLIKLDEDGKLTVDTALLTPMLVSENSGLTIGTDNKIAIAVGSGIEIENNKVQVKVGSGVEIDKDSKVQIKVGSGVNFNTDGALCASLLFDIEESFE